MDWIIPLSDKRGVDYRVRDNAREIERRTGLTARVNATNGRVTFCTGGTMGGPLAFGSEQLRRLESHDIDDAVRLVHMGRIRRSVKDKIGEQNLKEQKYRAGKDKERFFDDRRPDAKGYVEYDWRARRGVQKAVSIAGMKPRNRSKT